MSSGYHVNYMLAALRYASETLAFSTNKGRAFAQRPGCGDYATMNGVYDVPRRRYIYYNNINVYKYENKRKK